MQNKKGQMASFKPPFQCPFVFEPSFYSLKKGAQTVTPRISRNQQTSLGFTMNDTAQNPTGSSDETRTRVGLLQSLQNLWTLAKRHPWFSAPSAVFIAYFFFLTAISIGANTSLAQWLKANWAWVFRKCKWIHDLFHNEHGFHVHEIFLGLGGIAIGLFVAVLIEDAKRKKEQQMLDETMRIGKATGDLLTLSKQLTERIETNVKKISNYEELLDQIGRVIDEAAGKDGDLLMMNLTASFGYFMTFDADRVLRLEHQEPNELHKLRNLKLNTTAQREYFAEYMILSTKQERNEDKLRACVPSKVAAADGKVEYLTLATDGSGLSPFLEDYLEPSLRGATVKRYDSSSEAKFSIPEAPNLRKLYLIPKHLIPNKRGNAVESDDEMMRAFEGHLVAQQNAKIEWLKSINVAVTALREIPFQLYIWLPKNRNEAGRGVFMFVNQHTLARTNYTAAFWTENREVLETFKAMFESVREYDGKAGKPAVSGRVGI